MKKNKTLIICIVIIAVIGFILYIFPMNTGTILPVGISSFKEEKYKQINDNLYYTDELIKFKKENKKEILGYYKQLSNYLSEHYPNEKFFMDNLNQSPFDEGGYIFIMYQMIDNALATDTYLGLDIVSGEVIEDSDSEYSMNHIHRNKENVKANIKVTKKELKEKAFALAKTKENSSKMAGNVNNIKGTYRLEYSEEKGFYYRITLNKTSYVYIDVNGKVIDSYFFNGIYT